LQLGQYPMDWIEAGVASLGSKLGAFMDPGPLKDLLLDGVIGGVGGVIVFLPNILILYGFISFLEDSGYMARVAFIMDKVMHRLGLHGKSFIPLVMGFGCNVPAIMSSRIIESKSSRLITILITPFMSCSARIPIYVLLCGCFFPEHASLAFMSFYVIGIVLSVVTARLLRRFWFKKDETPFVMELPPYRMPTLKSTAHGMWNKAKQYLKKMGGLILVASIIIWALSYFPRLDEQEMLRQNPNLTEQMLEQEQQSQSYLGRIGHFVEPVVKPLGFDWKMSVSLIAGAAAKEVVVSTLGVLYTGQDDSEELLAERLTAPNPVTGVPPFTPVIAYSFLLFVLIYFPCIATIAAIVRETGSWRYGLFSV
ncbi:MAG: ferrous iron transport protein B, partial [Muribaculaceae bacterium]|nr:ferrous iron transport protein B [Muribaculaceae bacterium]